MSVWRIPLAELVRPIRRWAPRGYGFFYQKILGSYYANYPSDPELKKSLKRRHRVFWDPYIKANVYVDIGDWACRWHYFQGIYYDRIVPLLISKILSNGGTFIDIGANRGIHSLYAAMALDGRGHVYAFEPNPTTFEVLQSHMVINGVRNCTLRNMGLSFESGELSLNAFSDDHSGTCSFLETSEVSKRLAVPVSTLDNEIDEVTLQGPILVKIDVEGFEHFVLQGSNSLLSRRDVTVICEVTDTWLKKAGSSAKQLIEDMVSRGYVPLLPEIRNPKFIFETLDLQPIEEIPEGLQFDVVFTRSKPLSDS